MHDFDVVTGEPPKRDGDKQTLPPPQAERKPAAAERSRDDASAREERKQLDVA